MISYQNYILIVSVLYSFVIKIVAFLYKILDPSMYTKGDLGLTNIAENAEIEEVSKWVPKKKHEILKAKYKCLKKLFQVYDASLIGILPEPMIKDDEHPEECKVEKRKQRSHRTKTDICTAKSETSNGDLSVETTAYASSEVLKDLNFTETSINDVVSEKSTNNATTNKSSANSVATIAECHCRSIQTPQTIPLCEKKMSRFQCFIHRIFGIKSKPVILSNGHILAASDNNITNNGSRRRRRGIRLLRKRRAKKIQSETTLQVVNRTNILSYVQSVQRNCLMDTTARQCPIVGCQMMFFGDFLY